MFSVAKGDPVYAGQALYTPRILAMYDTVVYGFNYPVFFGCTKARLVKHYDAHASTRHLDIGVGNGGLLDECRFASPVPTVTIMDINPNSLKIAARRIERYAPGLHHGDVLAPWDLPAESFDSVAMTNLLHCLPGSLPDKAVAFEHARAVLSPGGVLFGATVPGNGVRHTRRSRLAIAAFNRRGIFSNLNDRLDDLIAGLDRVFDSYQVSMHGVVALFMARTAGNPRV
ncbi:methyltransferase [Pseudomonas sp.]|uniref:methyltransferase n=1 Tax=Pseudomonas sp. TaxID=306 RepID=UPI002625EBBA|nr:methyltransferase [Pseudomonas sp.]